MRKLFLLLLILFCLSGISFANANQYVIDIGGKICKHGLVKQPGGGPFSVFVFCDDALGSNIGVINTEPAAGPGSIKLMEPKIWIWTTDDRFWQERIWASDVTSFAWAPDKTKLFVATSQIYGSGGLFELDFLTKKIRQVAPKDRTVSTDSPGVGFLLTKIDIKNRKLYYKSLERDNEVEEIIKLEINCDTDLDYWLDCNNSLFIDYLEHLTSEDIGKKIDGVELTDGNVVLKGFEFIGSSDSLGVNAHVNIFKHVNKQVPANKYIAYIWVNDGDKPFRLPACRDIDPLINFYKGPHVLSGDMYTWDSVQPSHGVVSTICVQQSWLDAVGYRK